MSVTAIFVLGLATALMMWRLQRAHVQKVRCERRSMFNDVLLLLDGARLEQQGIDYPALEGYYRGYPVRLRALDDHLGYRKLPSLWLIATVRRELPVGGVFDFLVRPENLEYYSPSGRLPHAVEIPSGWPQHAWLRTDHPEAMPSMQRMAPYISEFEDRRMKELVVSSRGVRFVYQAQQADGRRYRILRSVLFEDPHIEAAVVRRLLDRAIEIGDDLSADRSHAALPA